MAFTHLSVKVLSGVHHDVKDLQVELHPVEGLTVGGGHVPDHHERTARHHRGGPLQAGGVRRRGGAGLVAGAGWRGDEEEEEEEEERGGRQLHVVVAGRGCSSS